MEDHSRTELEAAGCPPAYAANISYPFQRPEDTSGMEYWEPLGVPGHCLQTQLGDWLTFLDRFKGEFVPSSTACGGRLSNVSTASRDTSRDR